MSLSSNIFVPLKRTGETAIKFALCDYEHKIIRRKHAVKGQRSIDGEKFEDVSGTITYTGNGKYIFVASAEDKNGDTVIWLFTANGAVDLIMLFTTATTEGLTL